MEPNAINMWIATCFISAIIIIIVSLSHFVIMNKSPRVKDKDETIKKSTLKTSAGVIDGLNYLRQSIDTKKFRRVFDALFQESSSIIMFKQSEYSKYIIYMKNLETLLTAPLYPTADTEQLRKMTSNFFAIKSTVKDLELLQKAVNKEILEAKRKDHYVKELIPTLTRMYEKAKLYLSATDYTDAKLNHSKMRALLATRNCYYIHYESAIELQREFAQIIAVGELNYNKAQNMLGQADTASLRLAEEQFLELQRKINGNPN